MVDKPEFLVAMTGAMVLAGSFAAFLIAKPFQPANVSAVISQALFFQQSARRREVRATA